MKAERRADFDLARFTQLIFRDHLDVAAHLYRASRKRETQTNDTKENRERALRHAAIFS